MKYKCIGTINKDDKRIAKEGDIIIIKGDDFYNITTGVDYKNVTFDEVVGSLIAIVDDMPFKQSNDEKFKEIITVMYETFKKKNHDYGDSFNQMLDEEGFAAMRVQGGIKWDRFKNLSKGKEPLVKGESLRDSLLDLANYCILTTMWLDGNTKNL